VQIAIITGEASGDRAGAQLAREIRALRPDAALWGAGGKHMASAGVELIVDSSRFGVIGLAAAIPLLPRMFAARADVLRTLKARRPEVVVPIDAGAVNVGFAGVKGVCPWVRENLPETRVLYYFPPGSWRRTLKGSPLARLADKVATPFPWSETELRRFGADATFVGHPLLDLVKPSESPAAFADRYGIDPERPVVGILPGSRPPEIESILPVELAAASVVHQRVAGVQFVLALAPTVDRETVIAAVEREREIQQRRRDEERRLREADEANAALPGAIPIPAEGARNVAPNPADLVRRRHEWLERAADLPPSAGDFPLVIVEDATYDVMAASDVLMAASGTATLEAAILGKPMVITYKMPDANRLEWWLLRLRGNLPEFIGLPNILAGRGIVPEYVQDDATPEAIADEVIGLLLEPERILKMRADLREAVAQLGEPGGAGRTARMVVELAESGRE
jgi:lipid-A-disaccharide synthase